LRKQRGREKKTCELTITPIDKGNLVDVVRKFNDKIDATWEEVYKMKEAKKRDATQADLIAVVDKWWKEWMKDEGDDFILLEKQDLKGK